MRPTSMRRLIPLYSLLLLLALWPTQGWGAIAFVASVAAGSAAGGDTFTTGTMDTTGANLIVCGFGQGNVADGVVTDSNGNTWATTTMYSGNGSKATFAYSTPSSVGAGHTFTLTGTDISASMGCLAFSGARASSPFDVENGATTAPATSLATGSISAAAGSVAVSVLITAVNTGSEALDNSFIEQTFVDFSAGAHFSTTVSYKLDPGTVNPTWTWTTSAAATTAIASFLEPAASTTGQNSLGWLEVDE